MQSKAVVLTANTESGNRYGTLWLRFAKDFSDETSVTWKNCVLAVMTNVCSNDILCTVPPLL